MKIHWSHEARSDLDEIVAYIQQDSVRAGRRGAHSIIHAVEGLIRFPQLGRIGQVPGTRELILPSLPYLVIYRVSDQQIDILRVLHGAQLWL